MTRHRHLPYDSEHPTPVERAVQHDQEGRKCHSCHYLEIHPKGGARRCCLEEIHDHNCAQVMSGQVLCEDFEYDKTD